MRAKQHVTLKCVFEPKQMTSSSKPKQTSPWRWLLSKWHQKHTVTAKTTTQNMIFQWKNKSRWFWGKATQHLWLFVLMKQTCNKNKWKQMSTWGWPLSRWCQQHTVTANTVTQDMFFPMTHHVEKIEGKAKHCIFLLAWTKKLDHQDQLKTNTKLVLNFSKNDANPHCHCWNQHTKHDFFV